MEDEYMMDENYRRNLNKAEELTKQYRQNHESKRQSKRKLETTEDAYGYYILDDYGYATMYTPEDQYLVSYTYATYDTYQAYGSKIYYNSKYNMADNFDYNL